MSDAFDAVVIGAGHNGLTTAGLLAKAGRKVLVVESRDRVGGLAALEEFHPGYRCAGVLHDSSAVWPSVVEGLDLERHGMRRRAKHAPILALDAGVVLHEDAAAAAESIRGLSARDSERYLEFRGFLARVHDVLIGFLREPPVDLVHPERSGPVEILKRLLRLRMLGARDMHELLRLPTMCVADWLDEWFACDALKAALAMPAMTGAILGPRSPGSNANLLLWEAATAAGVRTDTASLIAALERAVRHHGVEIRTSARVRRIATDSSAVRGVVLEDGDEIRAPVVAASCDPKRTFLELFSSGALPSRLEQRIRGLRARGSSASVRLAVSAMPRFASCRDLPVEHARSGRSLDELERAHDCAKRGALAEAPVLEAFVPSVSAPDLAPQGGAVLAILVHFAPHELRSGWNARERERLAQTVIARLEEHAPGLAPAVVGYEVLAPPDIEARFGVSGGHLCHGEHALDQRLVRPTPECSGHRTPIRGLYLCGSGTHPGGGLTCGPGALAASTILHG
jgi:phytoene dehydrogenase-like protein